MIVYDTVAQDWTYLDTEEHTGIVNLLALLQDKMSKEYKQQLSDLLVLDIEAALINAEILKREGAIHLKVLRDAEKDAKKKSSPNVTRIK